MENTIYTIRLSLDEEEDRIYLVKSNKDKQELFRDISRIIEKVQTFENYSTDDFEDQLKSEIELIPNNILNFSF